MAINIGDINTQVPKEPEKKPKQISAEEQKTQQDRTALEEERIYRRGVTSIRDLIAPASFEVNPKYLVLSGVYCRTLFVVTYPRNLSLGWSNILINMNRTFDIAMYFYPIKAEIILKQLQKRVGIMEAGISVDAEKGKPRDPVKETGLRDVEALRDALTQGIEHFFQFGFYITIYEKTEDDLEKATEEIESIFGSKLIYTKAGYYQAEQGFNATLPLGNDELLITYNMNTSPIAASFPFVSAELTSDNGILYGINRHNNSLILFDRFSLQNANSVVFATSGAGKSYAVKLEILRSLMMGVEVIVIDPEMEYKALSEAVGGTYINVSLASEAKVNPFDLPRAVGDGTKVDDIIRSAVITIKGLLRIMIGQPQGGSGVIGFSPEEDSMLDRALIEAYAKKDITADLPELSGIEEPVLSDLQEVLEGMEGAGELVERLRKYTEGTFSGLLNSATTVEMNNQLVIFSVRDLEDELRPMAVYTIVNYIWNVVRSERKKRVLVIDEAWWLMQYEDSAKFIFALVKRARKYFLGVTTITQDVNDFLGSQYGQAIVTNSSLQLLLKQSPAAIDNIQKTFNLTDGEKYLLLESSIGEGIFFAGARHAAIKIVASYTEDQIVTTNPQQLLEQEQQLEEAQRKSKEQEEADVAQVANETPSNPEEAVEQQEIEAQKAQEEAAAQLLQGEEKGKEEAAKIKDSLLS